MDLQVADFRAEGDAVAFVALTQASPTDGLASVIVASLEDAGFHPALDCDPRGWMHYYGWPRGSVGLLTIWIPEEEFGDASAFLAAAPELAAEPSPEEPSAFWQAISGSQRKYIYTGWLIGQFIGLGAWLALIAAAVGMSRLRHSDSGHEERSAI